ncbi:MAG: hypothetical protein J6P03_03445 [Opitutales bacterium]|nr:hypothetical protein [Opitutales bacterium]
MQYVLGLDCKLFRGAAGATAATEMTNVKNVTINLSAGSADITTRAAQGWRAKAPTLKEGNTTFDMLYDPTDADFIAVQTAFLNNAPIAFFVTDGQGNGLDCDFVITGFSQPQDLESAIMVSVTAEPTLAGRGVAWVQASGSTLGGAVTLSGTATVGQTLTAVLTSVTPSAAQTGGSVRWYRNAVEIETAAGATSYELAAADAGAVVSIVYTHPAYAGSLTAATATLVS